MILKLFGVSSLLIGLAIPALAQDTSSPSGDPTGTSKGTASDTNPVGKPVGKEPAMIDPRSTGSSSLDTKARVDCAAPTKPTRSAMKVGRTHIYKTVCK
ncbi:hypothetical protein [Rhizobium tubonense]|uniref:Uncharacterized protein n=1 Tax=Rhizobium tubonense TaxID=484088 RepID=A0A2W4CQJ3_9HYPH|nr:hypothetical protein [Rhizobium tubonense]PZM15007.1 hypothetical protein CPY51_08105 [Rhizobium tubonense]